MLRRKPIRFLIGFLVLSFSLWLFSLPKILFNDPLATVLLDEDGRLLSARIASDGQWRIPAADTLSPKLATAVITFEDRRFHRHWGIDPRAILRALRDNWRAGAVVSGGSTISMQVIRLAYGNPPRTVGQKIAEVVRATRLEWRYDKSDILKLWCDHAPFGGNIVGIEAAAWRYYGRPATDLSWAEAATLAVLPNSPGLIHPGRDRKALLAKRNRLLIQLANAGHLSEGDLALARAEPLPGRPHPLPRRAPHLLERLVAGGKGGRFLTSINAPLQKEVAQIVSHHHARLSGNEVANLAVLVTEVSTGQAKAYVANVPELDAEYQSAVDMIRAPRSPGSLLKPILYGLSLTEGLITPSQLLPDAPVSFRSFHPANFYESFSGAVPADRALARSLNIPFVHLLRDYGVPKFHHALQQYGFNFINQPPEHYGLSLVLGGCEVSMEQISAWFLGLSRQQRYYYQRQGQYSPSDWTGPRLLRQEVNDPIHDLSFTSGPIDAGGGWAVLRALSTLERPSGEGKWESMGQPRGRISWKTGTSFGFRDAWAVGTDGTHVVAVWAGNADGEGRPGLVGVQAAAPVLFDVFRTLPHPTNDPFEIPYDEMVEMNVCRVSGHPGGPHCPVDTLFVPRHGERAKACPFHRLIHLDQAGRFRTQLDCAPAAEVVPTPWFSLPPVQAHYYRRENAAYRTIPPWSPACQLAGKKEESPMQMIYPHSAGKIRPARDWHGQTVPFVFELAHRYPEREVHWHLDDHFIGTTRDYHTFELLPEAGRHRLSMVDSAGNRLHCYFEVL